MNLSAIFKTQKLPVWTAELVALLGLAFYIIQSVSFAYTTVSNLDEGAYLLKGYLFASGEYRPFDPGISTNKPPLAFLIPGYAQLLFGAGLRTGRYLAVFFGMMAVIGTWVAARRISGRWLAAAAVWTLAASPMVIKYYSGGATQSTIACMLAWMLALSLGEKRSFWELTLAGILAGLMMFVRQNMMPVLPLLILFAFWHHGRKAWGLAVAGLFVVGALFWVYMPDILQLWYWVPYFKKYIPHEVKFTGGGETVRWQPIIEFNSRLLSISQSIRFHFIPLVGSLLAFLFFPKIKNWKSNADLRTVIFLFLLFSGLLYMHIQAAIMYDYCVYCLSPYIAFFNVSGILLVAMLVKLWREEKTRALPLILVILISLTATTAIGLSSFEQIGRPLLNLPAPRIRDGNILPGAVTLWQILSNRFDLTLNAAMRYASAGFGFLAGVLILGIGYIIWLRLWRGKIGLGISLAATILLAGIFLSPITPGHVKDCNTDVIAANEQVGEYLASIIPPRSVVYWHGGLSAAPLLYLPDVKIFPAQINAGYSYLHGADTEKVIKFGYWNEVLEEQWKAEADFFIIEEQYYPKWKNFLSPHQFDEFPRSPVGTSCLPESRLRIFHRK